MAKKSLEVEGKKFSYTEGDESELEAYMEAKRHLDKLHREAIAKVAPAPGSQRSSLYPRTYDGHNSQYVDPPKGGSGNVVLTPGPMTPVRKES